MHRFILLSCKLDNETEALGFSYFSPKANLSNYLSKNNFMHRQHQLVLQHDRWNLWLQRCYAKELFQASDAVI